MAANAGAVSGVREIPRDAYNQFQQLKQAHQQLAAKIAELDAEKGEHAYVAQYFIRLLCSPSGSHRSLSFVYFRASSLFLTHRSCIFFVSLLTRPSALSRTVIRALQPLDKDRRCFRLIGGVLVERKVSEVLPAVQANHDNVRRSLLSSSSPAPTLHDSTKHPYTNSDCNCYGEDVCPYCRNRERHQ